MAQTSTADERQQKTAQLLKLLDELVSTSTGDQDRQLTQQLKRTMQGARLKAAQREASKLYVGQRVSFKGRSGRIITGTVERINQKTATIVDTDDGNPAGWRVSPASLTPVEA